MKRSIMKVEAWEDDNGWNVSTRDPDDREVKRLATGLSSDAAWELARQTVEGRAVPATRKDRLGRILESLLSPPADN